MSVLQAKLMQACPRSLQSGQGLPLFSHFSNYSMFMVLFKKSQEYFLDATSPQVLPAGGRLLSAIPLSSPVNKHGQSPARFAQLFILRSRNLWNLLGLV